MFEVIVGIIERVALATADNVDFFEGRLADTYKTGEEGRDAIHLYPFITEKTNFGVSTDLSIGFWRIDSPRNGNDDRRKIVASMDVLSDLFLDALEDEADVEFVSVPKKEPQYQSLSPSYSGYFVTIQLNVLKPCV
ncbi:hypothetical protein [Croceimicrobium sp.]|uniref:hypothetical protein n=1 Tax=Croceimicrobium sp. TaxID=2828340 RepID=UPI003BAD9C46